MATWFDAPTFATYLRAERGDMWPLQSQGMRNEMHIRLKGFIGSFYASAFF